MRTKKTAGKILAVLMLVAVAVSFSGCDLFAFLLTTTGTIQVWNDYDYSIYVNLWDRDDQVWYYTTPTYLASNGYTDWKLIPIGNYTIWRTYSDGTTYTSYSYTDVSISGGDTYKKKFTGSYFWSY